jgi:hypothetical protein
MKSLLDRLGDKFTIGDECWEWTAAKNRGGYGWVHDGTRHRTAHNVLYELLVGSIPKGLELDHLCRNRGCVRPDHLEPVTRSENIRRGVAPERVRERHRAVTHCPQGHPYDEANTQYRKNGNRVCGTCNRFRAQRWRDAR